MAGLVEGKVALVTGGGSGIGRSTASLFAREGAQVLVADIVEEGAQESVDSIRASGGEAELFVLDVSDEHQVLALLDRCVEQFGRIDCALNNAGISGPQGLLHQIDFAEWSRTLAINLGGVFLCMKHEIPLMQKQGAGAIVNMASGAGMIATPGMSPYCAAKHGVLGITRTAAVENAQTGVRINAVCPGSIDTPMLRSAMQVDPMVEKMIRANMPIGRLGEPHEIAEAVVWLCSERASLVSGHSMLVDGAALAR
jgi:NAD(P)-dependent dehydrogenase (short-subunit alcohol dehydrogenase family)